MPFQNGNSHLWGLSQAHRRTSCNCLRLVSLLDNASDYLVRYRNRKREEMSCFFNIQYILLVGKTVEFFKLKFLILFLGKHWCVEHFVCAKCEKPFLGNRHYERKGLAYCETHYHQLFGKFKFYIFYF